MARMEVALLSLLFTSSKCTCLRAEVIPFIERISIPVHCEKSSCTGYAYAYNLRNESETWTRRIFVLQTRPHRRRLERSTFYRFIENALKYLLD